MKTDVISALRKMEGEAPFDFIFMDPPYHAGAEFEVFDYLRSSSLVSEDTLIILEASLDTDFSFLDEMGYEIIKEKKYKTNRHIFVERR